MEFPHRPYIRYLISRRLASFEIMAACEAKLLLPPTDDQLRDMARDLGTMPASWSGRFETASVEFRRWLRDRRLTELWRHGPDQAAAERLLTSGDLRKAIEQLTLMYGDLARVHPALVQKFGERVAPSLDVLTRYRDSFWDIGSMTRQGVFDFLSAVDQKDYDPAARGEVALVYGQLGLRQRVEAEDLFDGIIALANQQVEAARRSPGLLDGNKLLGLSALARQAIDATERRAEIHTIGGQAAEDVKKSAIAFKLGRPRLTAIRSIEEVDQVPVEEEDVESSNVRKFPHPVAK